MGWRLQSQALYEFIINLLIILEMKVLIFFLASQRPAFSQTPVCPFCTLETSEAWKPKKRDGEAVLSWTDRRTQRTLLQAWVLLIPLLSSGIVFIKVLCDAPYTGLGVEVLERGWTRGWANEQGDQRLSLYWWLEGAVRAHRTIVVSRRLLHKRWQWVLPRDFRIQAWVMELSTCH